jgi:glycosyltransferase involved in cell wall biosynthesis
MLVIFLCLNIASVISILMPVKNAAPYLQACLDSIAIQSEHKWELIAVNDGSEDESLALLNDFAKGRHNVLIANNKGKGIIPALQLAYSLSKGEYVHRMDADDVMPPDKLKMLLTAWESNSIVTGKVQYFANNESISLGYENYQNWLNQLMDSGDIWQDVYRECTLPSPAWLIHRNDFINLGAFNSELLPEDYDLCFRAYKSRLNVITIKKVIHLWRDSQNRTSRKLPIYFPIAYYPLKVHYFLEIDRNYEKPLLLWGAGNKGKVIAQLLLERGEKFTWASNNPRKRGVNIYGQILQDISILNLSEFQIILAVSSPIDKIEVQEKVDNDGLTKAKNYFWFC